MRLVRTEMTAQQASVLTANFQRFGSFFLSYDLHPMLDCAYTPDGIPQPVDSRHSVLRSGDPLGVGFEGLLREEFFGGIAFDARRHHQFMLDKCAFEVVRCVNRGCLTQSQIVDAVPEPYSAEIEEVLGELVGAGVLVQSEQGSQHLREVVAKDLSRAYLQTPTIVEVELTYGCFRTCRHCAYESSPHAVTTGELTADQWAVVFDKLALAGVCIVQLTGGDPLFRSDAFDIIEAADRAGLSVYIRSDTAALSRENVERLQGLDHLWHVGTSIDGADDAAHDFLRGRGAFRLLGERIEALASAGISVAAGATLHKGNHASVRDIGATATAFGATWFDIGFLSPVGRGTVLSDLVLDESEIEAALESYLAGIVHDDYRPSHQHYNLRVGGTQPFADIVPMMASLPYITEWPFNRLRLDPTGSAYTAGKLKGSDFARGYDLFTMEVATVWDESPNLRRLRELGAGGRIHGLDYRMLRSDYEIDAR